MARFRLIAALAFSVCACAEEPVVPLVQLSGIAPRQVELGDKLEVEGAAFPQGRRARVVFEGAFHRPGEISEPDEVEAQGEVVAPDRIEVPVTETLLAAFCGAGSSAAHTTFEGTVRVVFAAQAPGAPPVSGELRHSSIDALPTSAGQARFLADAEDGEKLARSAGIRVEARPAGGLAVMSVESGSRAANAGILVDDVIVIANGVRVTSLADLAPPAGAASLGLVVRRAGGPEEARSLPLDGARVQTPRRFALPAAIVGALALLLALLAASPGRWVLWLRRRLADRRAPATNPFAIESLAGIATAGAIPMFVPSADVGLLAVVTFSGALAMALLVGTERERSTWRGALVVLCRIGPAAVALTAALVIAGSLRADELAAAQGVAPWGFFALRSPAHAALAMVFCAWGARREAGAETGAPSVLARSVERFVATLHAALGVIVFFGAWRLPYVSAHTRGAVAALATVVFVAKVGLLTMGIERLRAALPARPLAALAKSAWLRLVPIAIVAGALAATWERHVTSRGISAGTTFTLAALAAAAIAQLAWPRSPTRIAVDPLA